MSLKIITDSQLAAELIQKGSQVPSAETDGVTGVAEEQPCPLSALLRAASRSAKPPRGSAHERRALLMPPHDLG